MFLSVHVRVQVLLSEDSDLAELALKVQNSTLVPGSVQGPDLKESVNRTISFKSFRTLNNRFETMSLLFYCLQVQLNIT